MSTMVLAASLLPIAASPVPTTPLEALDSVFVVTTADSQGAGFVVTDRLMVTAAHVVEGSTRVQLEGTQDPPVRLEASVVYEDKIEDVAILAVEGTFNQYPLEIRSTSVSVGDEVFAAGSPIDGVVLSKGRVADISGMDGIVSSTPVDPGNSGGPLLDATGAVVGMVYAQSLLEGSAYSVPAQILEEAIAMAEAQPSPEGGRGESALGVASPASSPIAVMTLAVSLAALLLAGIALALVMKARRQLRNQASPITITLDEE